MHSVSILTSAKHLVRLCVLIAMVTAFSAPALHAQPSLSFKRVTVNWPTIELYVAVHCEGSEVYNMTKHDFRIYENGNVVQDFTQWCPDPNLRCASSLALVFDAGSSMDGIGNPLAKQVGHWFVDLMDGAVDEATIIAFDSQTTVLQQMTTNRPLLHSAVDSLGASGDQAVWDGVYDGINELIDYGVNQCRAVMVMTNGWDNSSTRTPSEIISLANRNRIRVFTIGLGPTINSEDLQHIALLTGGKFYQNPNSGQIKAIIQEITTIIFQWFQECVITYERTCADGSPRTVELQLVDFCEGSDSRTKTYRAPLDSSTFVDLQMALGSAECEVNEFVAVPLNLISPVDPRQLFSPMAFTLDYDETRLRLDQINTPPGSILEGIPIEVSSTPSGLRVRSTESVHVRGPGTLMEFVFRAGVPVDTAYAAVEIQDVSFEQNCYSPNVDAGEVLITPPVVNINTPPDPMFSLSVHPEPNNGSFTINIRSETNEKARIHLFDMLGRKVFEGSEFEVAGSTVHHVTAPGIQPGMYIMRIDLNSRSVFRKITRQ